MSKTETKLDKMVSILIEWREWHGDGNNDFAGDVERFARRALQISDRCQECALKKEFEDRQLKLKL